MMDNNERGDAIVDLDLNQEPLESSDESVLGLGSLLDELETAHGQIEERIRQLEAATARARQRQRWRQARNPSETSNVVSETVDNTSGEGVMQNVELGVASREGEATVDRAKGCKRDSTYLVAKALELDMDAKKVVGDGGGFFDCNICLDMAREPILTCCGHLFCWACFYQLPYVYPTAKECPVCKGEVTDKNVTPIYGNGNGNNTHLSDLESGLKVPPRPQAHRIESVRQQRVNRGISHIPVAEALRRIRIGIGATGELRPQRPNLESVSVGGDRTNLPNRVQASEASSNAQVGGGGRPRTRLFSRVLSESADSLLSISSALSNAERIVDDLESYLFQRIFGRSPEQGLDDYVGSGGAAVVQAERRTVDSTTAVLDSATPLSSSSESMHVSASDVHLRNLRRDTATAIDLPEPHPSSSSSSRRRLRLSRLDADNGVSREPRRRRLN